MLSWSTKEARALASNGGFPGVLSLWLLLGVLLCPSDLSLKSANIFLASLGNKIVLNICIGLFCCPVLYRH